MLVTGRDVGSHGRRVSEQPAENVDVVDGVLEEGPAAGTRDVGSPFGRVDPLDREVLVVAEDDGERASVPATGHLVDEGLEDRRVAQDQANLVRDGR